MTGLLVVNQPQIRLVDQGRGLERLAGLLVRQFVRREFAQFLVDQRQELAGRVRVTPLDGVQDLRDVAHEPGV